MRKTPELKEIVRLKNPYPTYPSQGITPERLAQIFREADLGDISRQAELFEEMEEKDAHLGAVLQSRKLAVAGLDWDIVPSGDSKREVEIASFVRDVIRGIENWEDSILDLLDAIGKGFSVLEIIWEIQDSDVVIREFKWRAQKLFTFMQQDGVSENPRLLTEGSPIYGEALSPNKFVVHRYRARSGITPRAGVLRPCAYMYLFKNYSIKDWVIFAERYAMPMRIGKFSASSTEAERNVLKNAVFSLGSDAAAVISDSTVIELLESATKSPSSGIYRELVEFCDRAISKAVLGQTLTTEQTGGTFATAKVHQLVRKDILEADSKALSKTIQRQIIAPLVEFNFGSKDIPTLKFRHEEDTDLISIAQTYKVLVEAGFDGIPKRHIYERFGIPVPREKEETLRR